MPTQIEAHHLVQQPVAVTRQMAAALPRLQKLAMEKGLQLHHLGAGYPHPEVSNPTKYIKHAEDYYLHLAKDSSEKHKKILMEVYNYADTLGPKTTREYFAKIYGHDFGFVMNPDLLIPTMGATGGIAHMCSLFERSGEKIAYLLDAPSYTGFLSRAALYQKAHFYSVPLDDEGPIVEEFLRQLEKISSDGLKPAFYYTIPDGHNPGGISFSQERRKKIISIAQDKGLLIVEDAPYTYISFETAETRPKPFVAMAPESTIHLFTASKIGLPGPRVGFIYSEASIAIKNRKEAKLQDLLLTEVSGDILLHNPNSLRNFEAYLTDENFEVRKSLWPVAETKNSVYRENRQILLDGLERYLGKFPDYFTWTKPGAGFFSVFTFLKPEVKTNPEFVEKLVAEYGVITIPMFDFYPPDARQQNPEIGRNQLRLSFSFNEKIGEERRRDMKSAVRAFANAALVESGLPPISTKESP